MAKTTGLAITTYSIDDSGGTQRAVVNDITNFSINTPRALQDTTGVDKSAHERLHLLMDATFGISYIFNDTATTGIFTVLKNYATILAGQVGRTCTITFNGTVGAHTLASEMLFDDFPFTRGTDGSMTGSANGMLADGTVIAWA